MPIVRGWLSALHSKNCFLAFERRSPCGTGGAFQSFAPHRNSIIAKTEEMKADIRRELAGDAIQGRVTIHTNGSLSIDPNRALTYIFSTFEPDDLGVIDFHAADRNYAYEHVTNVNINVAAKDEQWKNTAMYNLAKKYGNVKTALATDYIISVPCLQGRRRNRRRS